MPCLAALVAVGVEVADDAVRLFGDLEEVLLLWGQLYKNRSSRKIDSQ